MSLEVFKERDLLTINIYLQLEEKRATGDFRWPREWRKPERDNDLNEGHAIAAHCGFAQKVFHRIRTGSGSDRPNTQLLERNLIPKSIGV
jgi:hypothetical protein